VVRTGETRRYTEASGHFFGGFVPLHKDANDRSAQAWPSVLGQPEHIGLGRGSCSNDDRDVPRNEGKETSWPIKDALCFQRGDELPAFGFQFTDLVNGLNRGDLELQLAARRVQVNASDDHHFRAFLEVHGWSTARPHHGVDGRIVVT
jgi:hypothetical protein